MGKILNPFFYLLGQRARLPNPTLLLHKSLIRCYPILVQLPSVVFGRWIYSSESKVCRCSWWISKLSPIAGNIKLSVSVNIFENIDFWQTPCYLDTGWLNTKAREAKYQLQEEIFYLAYICISNIWAVIYSGHVTFSYVGLGLLVTVNGDSITTCLDIIHLWNRTFDRLHSVLHFSISDNCADHGFNLYGWIRYLDRFFYFYFFTRPFWLENQKFTNTWMPFPCSLFAFRLTRLLAFTRAIVAEVQILVSSNRLPLNATKM